LSGRLLGPWRQSLCVLSYKYGLRNFD
jgi:hypothetical protein